jgi:membrane-associated phospholipid phosphatase
MLKEREPRTQWARAARELAFAFAAAIAYFAVRGLTEGSVESALRNAGRIERLQDRFGLLIEPQLQDLITGSSLAVDIVNWIYIWAHWPLIIVAAAFLIRFWPQQYYLTRNAFLISGGLGIIVFATFPVAPPRLAGLDVIDTVTQNSNAYRFLQPPAFTNQYAALPSLHFGWNLLIGIAIYRVASNWFWRGFGVLLPVAMGAAVVLTGNHYILDVVAGGAFALTGLWIATYLRRRRKARVERAQARLDRMKERTGKRTAADV